MFKQTLTTILLLFLCTVVYLITQTQYILTYTTTPKFEYIKTERSAQYNHKDVQVQLNQLNQLQREITAYDSQNFTRDMAQQVTIYGGLTKMVIVQKAFERKVFIISPNTVSLYMHNDNPLSLLSARFAKIETYFSETEKKNNQKRPYIMPKLN